ncbi:hypothetical protein [Paraglaciecola sp. 20A4]|uniref:hypothetical protein n=1 Tax=Paraglaciecola sp. 20A4 TaxID=2687288 RepID=UPI001407B2D1|nr:hypothetical protein [Paraglaciecola sp. 20A4]
MDLSKKQFYVVRFLTDLIKVFGYCGVILFFMNLILDVPINEDIPFDGVTILFIGIALIAVSNIIIWKFSNQNSP